MSCAANGYAYIAVVACLVTSLFACSPQSIQTKNPAAAAQTGVPGAAESAVPRAAETPGGAAPSVTASATRTALRATMTASVPTLTATETASSAARTTPTAANKPPASTALPVPAPTLSLLLSPGGAPPSILEFIVVPTTTVRLGDVITATWHAQVPGELCSFVITTGGPSEMIDACVHVPPSVSRALKIQGKDLAWDGLLLRVTKEQVVQRTLLPLVLGCQRLHDWFITPPLERCPASDARIGDAYAQPFERGWVLWTRVPNQLAVFYQNDARGGEFQFLVNADDYTPDLSAVAQDIVTPPAGLYAPVGTFGEIWRDKATFATRVRERLGWATAPVSKFESAYQCVWPRSYGSKLWTCYLRAPDGQVWLLHPDSTAQVHFLWSVR